MEFIFEIGCEDLPARFVAPLLGQLRDNFVAQCRDARLGHGPVRALATPRRLTLLVDALDDAQADLEEERTGPPAKVAFRDGAPTKAAEGFARGQGVNVDDLYVVETPKGEYVAAKVFEKGQPALDVLPPILQAVLNSFNFPKSMRWADYGVPFARPVRWIVARAGDSVVPVSFAGVTSGDTSYGHRFAAAPGADAAPTPIEVRSIPQYLQDLAAAHVVLDHEARRAEVARLVEATASAAGGVAVEDPDLVDEVTNLVEKPHAVLVDFDHRYLELPDEVLISSMRGHQRYFAVAESPGGPLKSSCVVIYNTPVRDPKVVAAGNLRVLKARLDDARFFWEQDQKRTLEQFAGDMQNVVWLQKIGSVKERADRMGALAAKIAAALNFPPDVVESARRAGTLAKADLVTSMVYEFPDLQGTMGREYARLGGEPDAVATAIYEQYLPRGADEELPATDAGACVALAEKLDALVGCFLIDLVPTSTADPYALRRAAIGMIRILQDRGYSIGLERLVGLAAQVYSAQGSAPQQWNSDRSDALLDFFRSRLKSQLASQFAGDVVEAVLAVGVDNVLEVAERTEALAGLREQEVFGPLAEGFKRVVNILRKQAADIDESSLAVSPERFAEPQERGLYEASMSAGKEIEAALEGRDWRAACAALANLKDPVDDFFDHVMVMTDDADLKRNRLALLFELQSRFLRVADLSVIS